VNYAGIFDAARFPDGPGGHGNVHGDVEGAVRFGAPPAHAPADAIVIPDAHFLFNGDFKRAGADLILSADGRELVLHDYFKGETRHPLASPDGAHLTGDLVNALTGSVQVSQADGAAAVGKVIGHVTKLQGTATAIRNGVSILLHNGDNVEKGDVVQSGSDSTLGITFVDGTVFGLSSNARMVLNEMIYDPNGSNNSSLLSLVAGTISFVAGETAKHGDMKVDTPVATMGIRGTAVLVEIDFTVPGQGGTPNAKFQVLVEPDGRTGSYVLLDKTTLQPLAVVDQAGQQISIENGVVSQTTTDLPPDIQKLINDVFSLKFTDNTNPKSTSHFTDVGVLETTPLHFGSDGTALASYVVGHGPLDGPPSVWEPIVPMLGFHFSESPSAVVLNLASTPTTAFAVTEKIGKTGDATDADTVLGKVSYADVNAGDQPSVSVSFKAFTYQDAQHHDVSASLNALQLQHIDATEVNIVVSQDPAHKNFGTANWSYSVPDKAFDFLAAGETLTLTYIVRVNNNFAQGNQAIEIPITITVIGTNDAPVITTGAQTIALSDDTGAPGGSLTSHDPTSGSVSFADADLTDTHTVSSKLAGVVLQGGGALPPDALALFGQAFSAALSADSTGSGNGTINWSLASLPADVAHFIPPGQTLTLTYVVTVTDSYGATSEQSVTVTITGTANPDEIWIATGGEADGTHGLRTESLVVPALLWSDGANWKTGHAPTAQDDVIIITDPSQGLLPAFPVTIDQAAVAKSVTMNDSGGGNTPELDNLSTLTISGGLTAHADAIVHNAGTINVGGHAEFLDQSVLVNSGKLLLASGGDFSVEARIINGGTIELGGGTLNVFADLVNADGCHQGLIQVDAGAKLVLAAGDIEGGKLAVAGALELDGGSALRDGMLANFGAITISGGANAFDGEIVVANHVLEIMPDSTLALDGTYFNNEWGSITVDDGATLSLDHASIAGGTVHNSGAIDVVGSSTIEGSALDGGVIVIGTPGSQQYSDNALLTGLANEEQNGCVTLTLDGGATVADAAIAIGSSSKLLVGDLGATLSGSHVENDGLLVVASCAILDLAHTDISGAGSVHVYGEIDSTGASSIAGPVVNDGWIEVKSGTLDVNGCVEGCGAITIDVGATLELGCTDAQLVRFDGKGSSELVLDTSHSVDEIQGFGISDKLDLKTIAFNQNTTVDYDKHTHVLTVSDGNGDTVSITLSDTDVANAYFATADDGHGGTLVTLQPDHPPVILGETNPSVQTVILSKSPIVLPAGTTTNTAGLSTETFDDRHTGSPANNGHGHGDFYSSALHAWFDADGNAGVVHGSSSVSAAPYQDDTNYLSVGAHAQETITFDHQQNSFGLYWGSVDTYNGIEFYNGDKLVASYDGDDIAPLLANGGQGSSASNGYVEFLDLAPFNKVVLQSSQNAFELDNVSAGNLHDSHVKLASAVGGTLTVSDKDIGDTLTASVTGDATAKYNGSSHLPANIDADALVDSGAIKFDSVTSDGKADVLHWTYDPAGANLDFLEPGDTLTLTYQAKVSDGHGSFGLQPLTITIAGNGASTVAGTAQNDTFDDVGGGVTIFGKGGNDTFVFAPHFGSATIADFDVGKDVLELDRSLFGATAQDVLNSAHDANSNHDTVLTDAAHETITLKGVTFAQFAAHQNDFHIV